MYRILFLLLFIWGCNGSESSRSITAGSISGTADQTIIPTPGKIDIIQDSFTFFMPNNRQGFFVYPQSNLSLFKSHFFVQINISDIITCGIVKKKYSKKSLTVKAELTKTYKGDVSGIANICSGKDARIFMTDGNNETTLDTKPFLQNKQFKTPRLIFPYIPYFGFKLSDVATSTNDQIQIAVKIEFFDRISKSTITNCTHYTINGVENSECFGVPVIYPEITFYGKIYKSQQLHPIRSSLEYLEPSTAS